MLDQLRIIDITQEDCSADEFDCSVEALNNYLRRYARQNHERNIARTFVAVDTTSRIVGYYSLASAAVEFDALPEDYVKRLPKYPIPAARLARLAVDRSRQGTGVGAKLLVDALKRILSASMHIGVKVVIVDAKDEKAKKFYIHFGFVELPQRANTLFLPIETVMQAVEEKG